MNRSEIKYLSTEKTSKNPRNSAYIWAIFLFQKLGTDSVNHADSGDTKILNRFLGNPILKFLLEFWNFVGCFFLRGGFNSKSPNVVTFLRRSFSYVKKGYFDHSASTHAIQTPRKIVIFSFISFSDVGHEIAIRNILNLSDLQLIL